MVGQRGSWRTFPRTFSRASKTFLYSTAASSVLPMLYNAPANAFFAFNTS